jgi:hypothetical protein
MGYEFFCAIPVAVGAVLALVLGLFITLAWLEAWAAEALMRKAKGELVSYVVAAGETVWDASQNDKQSLVELAK